jgi:hypothetical protein
VGFEFGQVHLIAGPETVFYGYSAFELAELGLDHRPQVPGRVVVEVDDPAGFAVEDDRHAASYSGSWNRHILYYDLCSLRLKTGGLLRERPARESDPNLAAAGWEM